ncbi:GNAT family N-acetyltransferase [Candidatus Bathyarchaeota archaeon]|nr:GNAT family N-acetyltransferase [Candidatus Bathyarchaeota archaeon]MBS7627737.1 GNAT family N-acetyltransferase [Candidatus Bathyarchaeota archaeon]
MKVEPPTNQLKKELNGCEEIKIKLMDHSQVDEVAYIASISFAGMKDLSKARLWIACNLNAFPRCQYYVAEGKDGHIHGYILWIEKGGFREEAVWELEQIAVHPECRGRGIGSKLIKDSLKEIRNYIHKRGSRFKLVLISTGMTNQAQHFYEKVLGAKLVAVIPDFFRQDEAIMIARNVDADQPE